MAAENKNINTASVELSTSDIISDILTKYSLKENEKELIKKYFGTGEDSNGSIIFWAANELFTGKEAEKNIISKIGQRLHISQEISAQIVEDIKKMLLPILKGSSPQRTTRSPIQKKIPDVPNKQQSACFEIKNDSYREPIE